MSASLELGNGNWAVKSDALLGYKTINGKYYPREFVVTRATTATRVNPQGFVEVTPYNLASWSEQFDNLYWAKTASTVTSNSVVSPSGATDADTLTADGTSSRHDALLVLSATSGTTYTYSVYAKKNTNDFIQLSTGGGFGSNVWANFNLATGVVGSVGSLTTASIQSVGDGWYRCTMTGTATLTGTTGIYNLIVTSTTASRLEVNTLTTSIFIWGAQLVEGTEPLDYLPTTDRLDIARIDYSLGSANLLLEPQRTNSIRNSTMVGASVGTNTLPTNWTRQNTSGLTQTVVGLGTENGVNYIDINLSGIAVSQNDVYSFDTSISASIGQTWTNSWYFKLVSSTPNAVRLAIQEFNGGSFLNVVTQDITPTTSLARYAQTKTIVGTGVTNVRSMIYVNFVVGQTYNTTIRLAAPQMEQGAYATSYIPTTTTSVTRNADSISRSNIYTNGLITDAGGTWFVELKNNLSLTRDGSTPLGLFINTGTIINAGNGFSIRNGGGVQRFVIFKLIADVQTSIFQTTSDNSKVAINWNGTTADIFENGVKVVSATAFTPTAMQNLICNGGATPYNINKMALYPTPLSDTECINLTTL